MSSTDAPRAPATPTLTFHFLEDSAQCRQAGFSLNHLLAMHCGPDSKESGGRQVTLFFSTHCVILRGIGKSDAPWSSSAEGAWPLLGSHGEFLENARLRVEIQPYVVPPDEPPV